MNTVPLPVTKDELWLLQGVIRHEMAQQDQWHFPPASLALNDQIVEALLLCEQHGQSEATLQIGWGDCLAIDFLVPQGVKDANGRAIGRGLLLKSYRARAELRRGYPGPDASEEPPPSKQQIQQWVDTIEVEDAYARRYAD